MTKILIFFQELICCGLLLLLTASAAVGGNPGRSVIEQYYRSWQQKDLDAFLETQDFSSEQSRYRAKLTTRDRWQKVTLSDIEFGTFETALVAQGERMVARFTVAYRLHIEGLEDALPRHEENLALLKKKDGWKIEWIMPQRQLSYTPQALDDEALKRLEEERLWFAVLPPEKTTPLARADKDKGPTNPTTAAVTSGSDSQPQGAKNREPKHPERKVLLSIFSGQTQKKGAPSLSFSPSTEVLNIEVRFKGYRPGDFLTLEVRDRGREQKLFKVPVLVDASAKGVFPLRRPLSGWSPGRYELVAIDSSGLEVTRMEFQIQE